MLDLNASAVAVYLRVPGEPVLAAVVIVVSPLGGLALERMSLNDLIFPSVRAYVTGRMCTRLSYDIGEMHPSLGAFGGPPHTVIAAPLTAGERKYGSLTVF
ncbi:MULTISPECIES: hypothetical protein [unclassified Streptomyces]|uniref:hypothetical protein n=1 Tax=unclassified Streptomyces TaxID=2593676 RepID=UPI003D8ADB23